MKTFDFVTDTGTICIFDLASLKHRLADDADWWSVESEELLEVNQGNAAFINLGTDGKYSVVLEEINEDQYTPNVICNVNCPSGQIFIGAGEEVTSDGLEPECLRGGIFLNRDPGAYRIALVKRGVNVIGIDIRPVSVGTNQFNAPLRI